VLSLRPPLCRPFPTFIKSTLAKFPDAGVCSVEEARVLNEEGGYTFLDVRTKTEFEYKITNSVNVPIINAAWRFDAAAKCKLPTQSVNADFVKQVQAKFKPDAKLIITCSDGRTRSMAALSALDDAGYANIVGMRQGYNGFSRVFDAKFARRVAPDAMKEVDAPDFLDQSTGIHGTGAGFERVDSVPWVPVKDPIPWLDFEEEVAKLAAAK
jgi:rhodanese-related sulfurtransferase